MIFSKVAMRCFLLISGVLFYGQAPAVSGENQGPSDQDQFNQYWYAGEAEITRYELQQARYGELRKGDAVLIFVTEDFLLDKQVKYEFGDKSKAIPILKLNSVRKFYTGIYPYSIMTSVFTPVDMRVNSTLKVSFSAQEWCGHTFMQLNNCGKHFDVSLRSYFQAEGDRQVRLKKVLLEDEVWTRIRLNPDSLPTGEIEIIPGVQHARLRHVITKIEKAAAHFSETSNDLRVYTLEYGDLNRTLSIKFEKNFPYRIVGWEERHPSGFGPNARILTTTAVATKTIKLPYWSKNKLSDSYLKEELGLIY